MRGEDLSKLIADGYVLDENGRVRIAPRYMFVMNGIIEKLMLD